MRKVRMVSGVVLGLALMGSATAQQAQTLPPGLFGTYGGSVSSWPFNAGADQKWQWVFDTSLFDQQAPIVIQEISIRLSSPTAVSSGGAFAGVTVTLASSPNHYILNAVPPAGQSSVFQSNLGSDAMVVRAGPWVSGAVAGGAWIPLGITPGFVYDPSAGNDFVIQIETCGTSVTFGTTFDLIAAAPGALGANRYGHLSDCNATMRNNNANEAVLVVKLDYTAVPPTWQVNQPTAAMTLQGGMSNGFGPITATRGPGQAAPITANSTLLGAGFDAGISSLVGVPLGGGAFSTPGGQIVNLDLSDPNLTFFFNLQFNVPFAPVSSSLSLPIPGTLSLQLVILDPLHPDGFSLSALNTLIVQ